MQIFNETFRKVSESRDSETSLKNENVFFGMVISWVFLIGAVGGFIYRLLLFHENVWVMFTDSLILISFIAVSHLTIKVIKNQKIVMYVQAALISVILAFSVIVYYQYIGPAVWTISFMIGVVILVYSRKEFLIIFSITNALLSVFVWLWGFNFDNWKSFYLSQTMLFIMLFFAFLFVFKITRNRQIMISNQYNEIATSEEKLVATIKSVGDGVITTGIDGNIEYMNPVAETLTGWSQEDAFGKPFESIFRIVNEYTRLKIESPIQKAFKANKTVELANHTILIAKDGSECAIEDTASPIKDNTGKTIGAVLVFRDFSEKKAKREQIEYLSYHDQLTGLYNRRFYEEEIKRLDTPRNLPLSFVFADVNGLKTINDAFGHYYGDLLLKQVANEIKRESRRDDIIARTGGDEFIMLLPKTSLEASHELTNRIKEKIEQKKIMDINLSISFGCDTKENEEQPAALILKNAEDIMYQKKILDSSSKRHAVIKSILNTLRLKSPREDEHSRRVSRICEDIAKAYQLNKEAVAELKISGELHDIGKIAVDEIILNKPGELTEQEWIQVKHHPETGYRLLNTSNEYFNISRYVLEHHERWDGKGYPRKLKGKQIVFAARVLAVADSYDAMTSGRPYRKALSEEAAVNEIRLNAGKQFDPEVARIFVEKVLGYEW